MEETLQVDIKSTTPIKCSKCEGEIFIPAYMFRKVSRLLTGKPKDGLVPIETFVCHSCGEPLEETKIQDI